MAKYTTKEFAALCNIKTNYLSVKINRDKAVVVGADGLIDDQNDMNRRFLEKIFGRMDMVPKNMPIPPQTAKSKKAKQDDEDSEDGESAIATLEDLLNDPNRNSLPYPELERIYKYLQGKKIEEDIKKTKIEISKKKGEVLPYDLIKPLFTMHNQSILTEFKNTTDETLRSVAHRYKIPISEVAAIKGDWIAAINTAIANAIKLSVKSVSGIVQEYSDKKGVGQRE